MDGENDAAQGGTAAEVEPTAAAQADGNPQDTGGGTLQAQEVTGDEEAGGADGAQAATDAQVDYEAQIAERDARITELEAQLATQEIDHELTLAGCHSTRAARALLDDYDGDVSALKAAQPWLFAGGDAAADGEGNGEQQSGTTGLKPTGADASKATVARWERLAGLSDDEDKE
ncbi:MAG: hypothetical protein HFJ65_02515 [Eggerthellaceae bacterium]|nr:hypothetical protein [Eggerthellaceae bacterium]